MSIKPVNGHLIIKPVVHDSFIATDKGTYDEVGIAISNPHPGMDFKKGNKVYFDGWLAAKFPSGVEGEYYWLVKWEDIRAVDSGDE